MVQTYSAGDVGPVDAGHLRDVLQDGDHTTGVNYIQNFKCQVKTKRMLLERIADAVGYEAGLGEQFVMSRVPSTDIIPSRIARIIKATPHWPRTLDAIRDHVKNLVGPGQSSSSPAPSQNMSAQQQAHYMEVKMLLGARSNLQKSDYFVAEANLQMTAFMLHWHSTVSCHPCRPAVDRSLQIAEEHTIPPERRYFLPEPGRCFPRYAVFSNRSAGLYANVENREIRLIFDHEDLPRSRGPRFAACLITQITRERLSLVTSCANKGMSAA